VECQFVSLQIQMQMQIEYGEGGLSDGHALSEVLKYLGTLYHPPYPTPFCCNRWTGERIHFCGFVAVLFSYMSC
jgi:hypothetical protein